MSTSPYHGGDGRETIRNRRPAVHGSTPIPIRRAGARTLVNRFIRTGVSVHGAQGGTLWVVLEYCEDMGIQYELTQQYNGSERAGYVVKLI